MITAVDVLTPETAKVGDGATIVLWSDRHACTIVKVTKAFVWVQRDQAVLSGDWKPEWISGGFGGHCVNQHEQRWTYTPDPSGVIIKFAWSKRYQRYGQPGDARLFFTRHSPSG